MNGVEDTATKNVIATRYLNETVNRGLFYRKGSCETLLNRYSEASWGDYLDTRCSTLGYVLVWVAI